MARFRDRVDAGRRLAGKLQEYVGRPDLLVLGLPRGGIPVAFQVAQALAAPLDVFVVRKVGVPGHEELAMGAIASGGVRVLNEPVVQGLGIAETAINAAVAREEEELERRERAYRGAAPPPDVSGKTVILVDDGLATGATMRAAVAALRAKRAGRIVVAVPTAAPETCDEFRSEVDEIICAETPEPFLRGWSLVSGTRTSPRPLTRRSASSSIAPGAEKSAARREGPRCIFETVCTGVGRRWASLALLLALQ